MGCVGNANLTFSGFPFLRDKDKARAVVSQRMPVSSQISASPLPCDPPCPSAFCVLALLSGPAQGLADAASPTQFTLTPSPALSAQQGHIHAESLFGCHLSFLQTQVSTCARPCLFSSPLYAKVQQCAWDMGAFTTICVISLLILTN